MTRRGGRTYAWLARPKGAPGEPFLPRVGELYLVDTTIYSFRHDPAADRPAVVICVPPDRTSCGAIQIVTRTTKSAKGVRHPADRSVGCDRDGVFSDLVSIEQQLWRPQNVERLGVLLDPYLAAVLERFS